MKRIPKNIRTKKRRVRRATIDALAIIDRITGRDRKLRRQIAEATVHAEVAEMLYVARTKAGLTQKQLADLSETKQPVIARLENADYNGHSLSMLQRIAEALHKKLEIRLIPVNGKHS